MVCLGAHRAYAAGMKTLPLRVLVVCMTTLLIAPALPDPPAHAPAHGYRDKNKQDKHGRRYRGYTGTEWENDYGVSTGRCNTDAALTAVGAVGGAIIGNRTASAENRTIATLAGAIIGGVIGNAVGDAIDESDRACMGHSLEVGSIGRVVTWTNPRTRVVYRLRPLRDLQGGCRVFEYQSGPRGRPMQMTACRTATAAWTIRQR
jgi:surface antigen